MVPVECVPTGGARLTSESEGVSFKGESVWVGAGVKGAVIEMWVKGQRVKRFVVDDYPNVNPSRRGQGRVWPDKVKGSGWLVGTKRNRETTWTYGWEKGGPRVRFRHKDVIK